MFIITTRIILRIFWILCGSSGRYVDLFETWHSWLGQYVCHVLGMKHLLTKSGTDTNWIYRIIESDVLKAENLQMGAGLDLLSGGKSDEINWLIIRSFIFPVNDIQTFGKINLVMKRIRKILMVPISHQTPPASLISLKVDVPQCEVSHLRKRHSRLQPSFK